MPTYTLNDVITNRIDKKVNYGKARTNFDHEKGPNNEAIVSPIPNPTHNLWINSHLITAVAPITNDGTVHVYQYNSNASNTAPSSTVGKVQGIIELTRDSTVASQRSWLACSTIGTVNTRLDNWLRATYGATYLPKFAIAPSGKGNGNIDISGFSGYREIYPQTTGEEYYFDYESGVFVLIGNPSGNMSGGIADLLQQTNNQYDYSVYMIKGWRYASIIGLQNYSSSGGGVSLNVTEINDPSSNVSVASVSEIQFDVDSGFALTDMGNNAIKVAMESTFKHWNVSGQDTITATAVDEITIAEGSGIQLTTTAPPTTTATYTVTVAYGNYNIDISDGNGAQVQPTLTLVANGTYIFDVKETTNNTHDFFLSEYPDGRSNTVVTEWSDPSYTKGGGTDGDGTSTAWLQVKVKNDTPNLYYACKNHTNMGGIANTSQKTLTITNTLVDSSGNIEFYDKYKFPNGIGTAGNVLKYPSVGTTLEWGSAVGGIGALTDVDMTTTAPAHNNVLQYDDSGSVGFWYPSASAAGISYGDLSAITTQPSTPSTLTYNSSTGVFTYTPLAESDPVYSASDAANINSTMMNNWTEAHGWGDHSIEGYLKTYSETDPVFTTHVAYSITQTSKDNWSTAYAWGNHASANYLDKTADGINALLDIDTSSLNSSINGYFLKWNSTSATWKPEIETIPTVLDDFTDVDTTTTTPLLNQVLKYDGTKFTPQLDTGQNTLAGLTDTDVTGVTNGKIIKYLNGTWELDDPPLTGATTFTGLDDTPTGTELSNSANTFVKVKSDGSGLVFSGETYLQNITQENLIDLYDVTSVLSSNDTDVLYYDYASASFKWIDYKLASLIDTPTPGAVNDQNILYYNHSTTDYKFISYALTSLEDVDTVQQLDDNKVLYYNNATATFKWKTLTVSQITDIDLALQGDDGKFLQYDYTNSKFKWTDPPSIQIKNENTTLTYSVNSIDFVGDGINAVGVGNNITATIPGNPTFIGQTDSPPTYTGNDGRMLIVNTGETGLQFAPVPVSVTTFLGLSDTPTNYVGDEDKLLVVDSGGTQVVFLDNKFTNQTDTPNTYTGQGGKYIAVKSTVDGVEFVSPPPQIDTFSALTDTPGLSASHQGRYLKVATGGASLEFVDAPIDNQLFSGLTDGPGTLSGYGGKWVQVNTSGTALIWADPPGSTFLTLDDTPGSYAGSAGYLLNVSANNTISFTNSTGLGLIQESELTSYTAGGTIDTDNVVEGNTNKYYTDAQVATKIGTTNANALNDVEYTTAPQSGDVLIYDGTNWKPATAPGSAGETNTASNVGTGIDVFNQKVDENFEFNSISSGAGISVLQQGNNIQIVNTSVGGASGAFIEEDDAIAFAIAFS